MLLSFIWNISLPQRAALFILISPASVELGGCRRALPDIDEMSGRQRWWNSPGSKLKLWPCLGGRGRLVDLTSASVRKTGAQRCDCWDVLDNTDMLENPFRSHCWELSETGNFHEQDVEAIVFFRSQSGRFHFVKVVRNDLPHCHLLSRNNYQVYSLPSPCLRRNTIRYQRRIVHLRLLSL